MHVNKSRYRRYEKEQSRKRVV